MITMLFGLALAAAPAAEAPCNQSSTVAIEDCQQRRLATANARLNAAYQARLTQLPPARQVELRAAERQWIAARDATCKVGPDQGTAGPLGAANCLLEQTDARTRQLARSR